MKAILLIAVCATAFQSIIAQPREITGAAGMRFVEIPAGNFVYGKFKPPYPKKDSVKESPYTDAEFVLAKQMAERDSREGFEVKIANPFYIGKYEVSQQEWSAVMKSNPSVFKGDSLPVDNVTWSAAMAFIERLNKLDTKYCYRLPTEFEWEYAARAGALDDISWDDIREQAQLGTPSTNKPGLKKPNGWGLYDMLGNVWEWTSDLYNEKIFADSTRASKGNQRVLKGASIVGDVKNATYMTHAAGPANGWDVGLRIVMELRNESAGTGNRGKRRHVESKKISTSDPVPGWHVSRTTHQGSTPKVTFENGVITLEQHPYGQGGVLLTNKKYRDFELSIEVKIDSFCNGGIFLRSTESGQAYQVELSEPGGTGNLFGEMLRISTPGIAEKRQSVWRPNDWNHFRIRMTGSTPRIAVWINDSLMYDVQQPKNDFVAGATEGMIGLQTHWSATYSEASKSFDMSSSWKPGGRHRFRNIRIRELNSKIVNSK